MPIVPETLETTVANLTRRLLDARVADGHWEGELSSSALSTATAVVALALVGRERHGKLIDGGLDWLARHQNSDGGWGDTTASISNISTTALCWAAFSLAGKNRSTAAAEDWLRRTAGSLDPETLCRAIAARYGDDRTFSAPILMTLALTGRLGPDAWRLVPQLPFELAACPHQWFQWLRLPVVSYALPALIAIGQVRHHHRPSQNPLARLLRDATTGRTLRALQEIQPASGGYLEATPITSFVVMSLAASGIVDHPVVSSAVKFLADSARPDGSWPIDTNLATWVTTLAVNALPQKLGVQICTPIRKWLLNQQFREEHPYTHAAPGGWAWTDRPGGVPDADDTAGALLALRKLGPIDEEARAAAAAGVCWLLDLQNSDGGVPTFCRGWGRLPFDRSSPDLTAHAIHAWTAWQSDLPQLVERVRTATRRGLAYLGRTQRPDGAWAPLWFGNQHAPGDENPTYGTARVLTAIGDVSEMTGRGVGWLLAAQNPDGGWGGGSRTPSSIEETGLALQALAGGEGRVEAAISRGVAWLVDQTDRGRTTPPSAIGFYFAKLWYYEALYPLIFALGGLAALAACLPLTSAPSR